MQTIWILNYNNYYNRTIKKEPDAQAMVSKYGDYYVHGQILNFNPNDGVTTTVIIGGPTAYNGTGNYAIVWGDGEEDFIESRWFIVENKRTRGGQYEVSLKRDVIADFYDEILTAPMFIEKATPTSYYDPAIFNKENMSFNQIKTSETKLWDHTKVPWLVAYCAKGETYSAATPSDYTLPHTTVASRNDIPNRTFTQGEYFESIDVRVIVEKVSFGNSRNLYMDFSVDSDGGVRHIGSQYGEWQAVGTFYDWRTEGDLEETERYIREHFPTTLNETQLREMFGGITYTLTADLNEQSNQVYLAQNTGKLYKFTVNRQTINYLDGNETFKNITEGSAIDVAISSVLRAAGCKYANNVNQSIRATPIQSIKYKVSLVEQSIPSATVSFNVADNKANGAPYHIFCMPYGRIQYGSYDNNGTPFDNNKDLCLSLMMDFIEKNTGANAKIYDAQILPYCPIEAIETNMTKNPGYLEVSELNDPSLYTAITSGGNTVGYVFHCPTTTVRYQLYWSIFMQPKEYKISNECDVYRLVSPNWNGQFEFSVAKNYGVDYINVDMELKPYQPYIHVAPNFKGLYGNRSNDAIGLICGGDFSLTQYSDAFATYARQNKNFQEIFDRQIQNLEVQQKYQRLGDIVGGVTGALTGAAGGAALGSIIPGAGAIGAAAGAAGGALASTIGAVADYQINESLRNEAIDYTKDQFGYQLGNIQALPDSLTKVSSFNPNNELFVFLEKYTCSDIEKEALKNKLKYNGYSIGRIGTINEFLHSEPTYIKGQLIRLNIEDDTHIVNNIAEELYKGVFI